MLKRRIVLVVSLAFVVLASVVAVAVAAGRPEPACACSVEPNLRGPAQDAAVRFEGVVRRGDVPGAWTLLTDEARSRYGNLARFRPVFDRLGRALREADAPRWLAVDEEARYDRPSPVVVVGFSTGPARLVWPLLVLTPLGRIGDERIDPEPRALRLTAVRDGDGVRVKLADGDPERTTFVAIDSAGRDTRPGRRPVAEGVDRLTWSIPPTGPILAIAIERGPSGPRIGFGSTP
ncbi:hypothetical protein OWR29_40075 [Actinoplanes sp. Pm04-4]|uniref:Uncharacterized protein n=1 Tax=Paractinoplanes pyxinae TaxID=2997416 RepID=A0ABT4BCI7_9ACTN|nr:hypothetical protein [Actinoplanes pyxinae]MCY1144228.1 hypothetical protein [Actinoplanes pyxinae]